MRGIKTSLALLLLIGAAIGGGTAANATTVHAKASSSSDAGFDLQNGDTLDVTLSPAGEPMVQIPVHAKSMYFGSWSNPKELWHSMQDADTDFNSFFRCYATALINQFGEDYMSSNQDISSDVGALLNGDTVNAEHPALVVDLLGCVQKSNLISWAIARQRNGENDPNSINSGSPDMVPYSYFKPGKNTLSMMVPDVSELGPITGNELVAMLKSNTPIFKFRTETIEVIVPELTPEMVAESNAIQNANGKSYSKRTTLSKLKPIDFGYFANPAKLIEPVAKFAGISVVLSVLIALPTALLENSIDENQPLVKRLLQQLQFSIRRITRSGRNSKAEDK